MQNKSLVLFLSPCLLDQKIRAVGLTPHPEIKNKILKIAEKYNAKIEQFPCPEFLMLGEREPKTYDEYMEIKGFKDLCKKLSEETVKNLKKLKNHHILIVGIARSPSCSNSYVHDRNNKLKTGKGFFMDLLHKKSAGWKFSEIDYDYIDASIKKIEQILDEIIY